MRAFQKDLTGFGNLSGLVALGVAGGMLVWVRWRRLHHVALDKSSQRTYNVDVQKCGEENKR